MKCPFCSNMESKVVDSRPAEEGSSIRRRGGEQYSPPPGVSELPQALYHL